jgi:hypothetical protein
MMSFQKVHIVLQMSGGEVMMFVEWNAETSPQNGRLHVLRPTQNKGNKQNPGRWKGKKGIR